MARIEKKTTCRTPTPGKAPTLIPGWKYDLVSAAIREVLTQAGDGGARFKDLPDLARDCMDTKKLADLGSVMWHVMTVKLEMEVRGDIARFKGAKGQMLKLSDHA